MRITLYSLRSGAAAEGSNLTSKELRLCGCRRAERTYSTCKVMRGDLVQGKEQRLRFAGAAVKRYPTSKVRGTQVRQWALREAIRGQTH